MPQPIDVQSEVGRATMVEKMQQVSDRLSLAAQQRVAAEEEEAHLKQETQVNEKDDVEGEAVDGDGRRRTPFGKRGSNADGEDEEGAESRPRVDGEEHQFDISI